MAQPHIAYQLNHGPITHAAKEALIEEQHYRTARQDEGKKDPENKEGEMADIRRARGFYLLGDMRDKRNLAAVGKSNEEEELWIVKSHSTDGYCGWDDEEPDHDEARIFDSMEAALDASQTMWGSNGEKHFEIIPLSIALQKTPGDINWPGNT